MYNATLGTNALARARALNEPVMAALGIEQPFELPGTLVFGTTTGPKLSIVPPSDRGTASAGNGTHLALLAPNPAAVHAFHAGALANGGTDEGAPGPRPHYHPNYYGAYVRDPGGNRFQAVCHSGKG